MLHLIHSFTDERTHTHTYTHKRTHTHTRTRILSPFSFIQSINKMKDNANLMFKNKSYNAALELYDACIDSMSRVSVDACSGGESPELIHRDLETTLHFNKASCFWKLSQESASASAIISSAEDDDDNDDIDIDSSLTDKIYELQRCEQSCQAALRLNPTHIKSFFRLVYVMVALGRAKEALQEVETFKSTLFKESDSDAESQASSLKICEELMRKCSASIILRAGLVSSQDPGTNELFISFLLSNHYL